MAVDRASCHAAGEKFLAAIARARRRKLMTSVLTRSRRREVIAAAGAQILLPPRLTARTDLHPIGQRLAKRKALLRRALL